jgi:flagellar biosynthesis anti-sigma factor FlgM
MKISDFRVAQIAQTYGPQGLGDSGAVKGKKAAPRSDAAALSPEAQQLLKGRRAVQDAPDVRAGLVAELRRRVQDGSYRVDEQALAQRLMSQLDFDE